MATNSTTPELAVITDNVDYYRFSKVTPNATSPDKIDEVKVVVLAEPKQETIDKMLADGFVHDFTQTVRVPRVGSVDGISELIPDEEERVAIFNRGVSQKLTQKLGAKFKESDESGKAVYTPTEEAFDPTELLREATQQRNLDPVSKAKKYLAGLDPKVLEQMLQAMVASQQAGQ